MPENHCPICGAPLLDDALGGQCPRCLLLQGLDSKAVDPDRGSNDDTADLTSKPGSVLVMLSATVDFVPRVQLRDTAIDEDQAPIVHPLNDTDPSLRYRIDGEIARGGMGAVLKGRDPDLGRDVAIKVLREDLRDNGDLVRRFVEEAQIGGQLQHPGVVPIYELGTFADTRPFFSMKLVKGQTLANLLSARQAPTDDLPRFLSIYAAIAQTMAYAHTRCVIHRDLKPLNVMVGAFGEVLVMDWGLAKVLPHGGVVDEAGAGQESPAESMIATARSGSNTDASQPGSILGTPSYMAPEQARGETDRINERADVFALGSILCEVLTGSPAFKGRKRDEIVRKTVRSDTADVLARLDAFGAEAELIELARDCLAVEPEDRPRDANIVSKRITAYLAGVQERLRAAELARAAESARAEEAIVRVGAERRARAAESARAEEAIVRVGAERRARRFQLGLAASILLAMTLGGGGWLWVKNERDARLAQVTRDVNDALNKVAEFRAQARTTTVGGTQLFAKAREQAQAALVLVRNNPVDDRLKDQVNSLWTELDGEEKDRALIAALDAASLAQVELSDDKSRLGFERAAPLFREAFRAYGLLAGEGEAQAIAERIGQRPKEVREEIIAALDDWDALAGNPTLGIIETHRAWIQAVLAAAEPAEGWTGQLRAARGEKDLARRQAALEKLAAADDVETLPARALPRLARQLTAVRALASAERLLRRAQQRYPADFWVNMELGWTLRSVTPPQFGEAVRYQTVAVALRPESSMAHSNLGNALKDKGQVDEALAEYRKAIESDPKDATAHSNLGLALYAKGQLDEAIAAYRQAAALAPPGSPVAQAMPGRIRKLEQQIALAGRLPGILKGVDQPKNPAERLAFAQTCYDTKHYAAAARLWAEALEADPKLGDDRRTWHRYDAACAAALAAAGKGIDEPPPDDAAKLKLREQARAWLQAELAAWSKLQDAQPQARPIVRQILQHWQVDTNLAAIRDAAVLAKLPEAERKEWENLWAEVKALLRRAEEKGP